MPRGVKKVERKPYQRRSKEQILVEELRKAKAMRDEAETECQRIIRQALDKFLR